MYIMIDDPAKKKWTTLPSDDIAQLPGDPGDTMHPDAQRVSLYVLVHALLCQELLEAFHFLLTPGRLGDLEVYPTS